MPGTSKVAGTPWSSPQRQNPRLFLVHTYVTRKAVESFNHHSKSISIQFPVLDPRTDQVRVPIFLMSNSAVYMPWTNHQRPLRMTTLLPKAPSRRSSPSPRKAISSSR